MKNCKEIKVLSIESLIPYQFNNRNHPESQVKIIANSIKEFGFTNPLIIDESNLILAGHGRYAAAQLLGLKEVPCIVKDDLSEAQKKAYRILDNKLTLDSTWNIDNLNLELEHLEDVDFPLDDFGLEDLKGLFDETNKEVEEVDAPEVPDEDSVFIKRGDIIELDRHRLMCGDSTSAEDYDALCQSNFDGFTLMVTDPPYGVEYDPSWREKAGVSHNRAKMGKVSNDDRADWGEVWKLWAPQVAYVWHASCQTDVVLKSLRNAGLEPVSMIIWNKERFALGRGDYHYKHEPCWYVVKKGCNHNWQGKRDQSTVWDIHAREDSGHGHGTQKPIKCMSTPIENNSNFGSTVADPFLGSGTTLIACEQLDRTCYGMEIEPKYCHVIIERYISYKESKGEPYEVKINGEKVWSSKEAA